LGSFFVKKFLYVKIYMRN